ncbi:MAG: phosphotransferase family protein [Saprospiraceae bacterium]
MEKDLFLADIPGANLWQSTERITAGWSKDQKFLITTKSGVEYLLRLSDQTAFEQEKEKYVAMQALDQFELPLPRLLDMGYANHGKHTYRLFSWMEGQEINNVLPQLTIRKQYELGWQAGQILKQIHQIRPQQEGGPWGSYYHEKIDRKIASFREGHFIFPKADNIIDFIERHRKLLNGRPTTFLHGDFHIGNMLLTPENTLAIIDFNRLGFGDPWEEFNRINWTASVSEAFAKGQINGYFEEGIPAGFFELMALYMATNQIGAFAWAAAYGAKEVKTHHEQTLEVLDWYDDFQQVRPKWYD